VADAGCDWSARFLLYGLSQARDETTCETPRVVEQWKVGPTRYHITVLNPEQQCRDVRSAELDGVAVDPHAIPLLGDSATHEVVVVLSRGDSTALELYLMIPPHPPIDSSTD
jgi:hypothetical protein